MFGRELKSLNHSPSWCRISKIYFQYPINWKTSAMVDGNMTKLWKKGKYFYADSLGTSALKFKFRTCSRSDALKFSIVEHTAVIRFCINKLIVVWARSKCLGCEKLICLELKTTSIITHWLKSNAWDPKMDISRSSFHKDTGTLRCSHKPNKLCDNPIIF